MPDSLYRITLDAATLLQKHPPQFRHPHKAALFEIAYPDGRAEPGTIEVTRWRADVPSRLDLSTLSAPDILPNFYDYRPVNDLAGCVEWHVNFADPRLFAAYGSGLLAQDEMQVVEHPLLGSVREALLAQGLTALTCDQSGATPILVRNVERRIELDTSPNPSAHRPFGLYGNRFAAAPIQAVKAATRRLDPPTFSNFIAMAAPSGGPGEYSDDDIEYIFTSAFTAFAAAVQETGAGRAAIVHTGFWGCGAFGGNRRLMTALQVLAARAAGVKRLVLHAGDAKGADEAQRGADVAESLALRCGSPTTLETIVGRAALLGYRWGVSDGN